MPVEPQGGLPGELLLLFTLVIWMLLFIIRLGGPQNVLNRWCFLFGMIFSIGVLKEYLYFSLYPWLSAAFPTLLHKKQALLIYSSLTGFFYYFSMPAALVFGMYFNRLDERFPRLFLWLKPFVFLPALFMGFLFPYHKTRYFQLHVRSFFPAITAYNLVYVVFLTYLLLYTLHKEHKEPYYRQKKMVALLVLLPIWYWLISALLIHALNLRHFFKAWQGNFLILLFLLIYFLCHAFREGIMGTRFHHEVFNWWDKDGQMVSQSARCIRHLCKNELSKIDWCAKNLETSISPQENKEYTHIILRASGHLKDCMEKMQYYSQELLLKKEFCPLKNLIESCTGNFSRLYPEISLKVSYVGSQKLSLHCDRELISEVFNNLIANAADAMNDSGHLTVKVAQVSGKKWLEISFQDTGSGILPELLPKLFDPYFSTKPSSDGHMGLGLYFCQKVMKKHGGNITVNTAPEAGSIFSLFFPWKSVQEQR